MFDAHTHLENGDLSIEYVGKFIDAAKEKGITHLQILDHTHRFFEFKDCYKRICEVSKLQEEWFLKKQIYMIWMPFLKNCFGTKMILLLFINPIMTLLKN